MTSKFLKLLLNYLFSTPHPYAGLSNHTHSLWSDSPKPPYSFNVARSMDALRETLPFDSLFLSQ